MPKHVGNPPIEESTGKAPAPSKPGPATGTSWAPRVGGWTRRRDPTQDQTLRDLHRLPKAHLHLHFTGSMRHETLLELAERDEVALPDSLVDQWPPRLSAADEKGWFRFQRLYDVARSVLRTEDDVRRLVRLVSRLRWVQQDRPGDPRLGAIGGSYGGGYQLLGAFESLRTKGRPVFDALAPQITWNDLSSSLAPEGVVRTEWALLLAAASVPDDALPPTVYKALLEGAALGQWPDGSVPGTEDMVAFMKKNGPAWHVANGRRLDIPVLLGQGTTDGLFPLQEGLENWRTALTKRARRDSIFVGYNGGHVLPAVLPMGVSITSDPCSAQLAGGDFEQLSLRFFDEQLRGRRTGLRGYGRLHIATPTDECLTTRSERTNHRVDIGTVATSTAAGVPLGTLVAEGPFEVAGSAYLTADVTAAGVENRAFYGLAVGTSPLDARLVQNNVLPLREPLPVVGERRRIQLPAVGVRVPAGQNLYLLASPFSETFVGMSSRTPGVIVLEDTVLHLRRTGPGRA